LSDSGSGGSAYDFENSRGINRAAYRVAGDSDTMSESSEDTFAEGPIDGEEDEQVDYNELFRQSRLHEMTTLFDTMMSLRRGGRGLQLDTPGNSNDNTPIALNTRLGPRHQASPAASFSTSAKDTPTSTHTEAAGGPRGGRRRSQTLQQRLFGTGGVGGVFRTEAAGDADATSVDTSSSSQRQRARSSQQPRLFGTGGFFRSSGTLATSAVPFTSGGGGGGGGGGHGGHGGDSNNDTDRRSANT
jgi:hypothetical protein